MRLLGLSYRAAIETCPVVAVGLTQEPLRDFPMEVAMLRIKIEFKKGQERVAVIQGIKDVDLKTSELEKIMDIEQFLEKLTGLRVHIMSF